MLTKKTENIGIKCTEETKRKIEILASEKEWTLSHTALFLIEKGLAAIESSDHQDLNIQANCPG